MALIKDILGNILKIGSVSKGAYVEVVTPAGALVYNEDDASLGTFQGRYAASTFRTIGVASNPHNIFSLENPVASGRGVYIRSLVLYADHTSLLATTVTVRAGRTTALPTGGTALTAARVRSSYGAPSAIARGANASDGGGATAITATLGPAAWSLFLARPHTLAGWMGNLGQPMLPEYAKMNAPFSLAAGEGLVIAALQNATTGAVYHANVCWEEYT